MKGETPDNLTALEPDAVMEELPASELISEGKNERLVPSPRIGQLSPRFAHVETWVFDLDNTLYPPDCDLWPKIDQRITLYLANLLGIDGISARALQKFYYLRYGTTLRGLMIDHNISAEDFLSFVHDIDRTTLAPNHALASAIEALPGRKLILTNGSRHHALATATALGIHTMFEDIFDIVAADFIPKPQAVTYDRFFDKHGVDPARAVMFEDLAQNLLVPHAQGMTTVLVMPKAGQMDHREAEEITSEVIPEHIDFATTDLEGFLAKLVLEKS